ncbi:MAG TPA: YfiR family protein [Woeseiaceae bacterium]|nr:YfiR family protein [Woeseiaceae bacterium]
MSDDSMRPRHALVSALRLLCVRGCILLAMRHAIVAVCILCCSAPAAAQEVVYQEGEVKAAFLYHFATFVQWPETVPRERPFSVAVLGDDEVAAELEKFLPGHQIQGRQMQVRRLSSIEDLADDALLFIGAGENHRLRELISRVEDRSMLVVTEAPGALKDGSMINFQVIDDRVRFEISLLAAQRAGLELSSRLLSAAMSVDTTSAIPAPAVVIFAAAAPASLRL